MPRQYPRGYLIVKDGEVESVVVRDPVQEAVIILNHPEATGTMSEEVPDYSWAVVEQE